MQLIIVLILIGLFCAVFYLVFKAKPKPLPLPEISVVKNTLIERVAFYQGLHEAEKADFEIRLLAFLSKVRITGVKTVVSDADRVLVAAAAIIPIFAFKGNYKIKQIMRSLLKNKKKILKHGHKQE